MKIINILLSACELLGLNNEKAILSTATEENESTILANSDVKNLLNLMKFSTQELCSHYVPIVTTQNITTTDKKYGLANLDNYIKMQGLYKDGEPIDYKIINRNIVVDENGDYVAKFFTYPEIESLFEDIDFLVNFSPDALIFGLCSYYSLSHGMFDDFKIMNEKYIEKAESLKTLRVFDLPQRRWE